MIFTRLLLKNFFIGVLSATSVFFVLILASQTFRFLVKDGEKTFADVLSYLYFMPSNMVDVFEPAMIIGAVIGISRLIPTGELTAMRALGYGRGAISAAIVLGSVILVLSYTAVMQWVIEPTELQAREYRGDSSPGGRLVRGNQWLKIKDSWVRLGKVNTASVFSEVEIFTLSADRNRIAAYLAAQKATVEDGVWQLSNVTRFTPELGEEQHANLDWQGSFDRNSLTEISVPVNRQSFTTLYTSWAAAKIAGQNVLGLEHEAISRLAQPIGAVCLMMWLVSVLFVSTRDGGESKRKIASIVVGLLFWIFAQLTFQFAQTLSLTPIAAFGAILFGANLIGWVANYWLTR
ncbi:MAG: LptF/LptG family permease [Gammaproteobacteria bacterium]|nr:LptF/LptG family permease [Gammaproteobacteria bacterium]